MKPRVVWDLDDVLNNLMLAWLGWSERPGDRSIAYSDLHQNPPHCLLGLTEIVYKQSLDEFRNSDEARKMMPVKVVIDWFLEYGHDFDNHVLTARSRSTVPAAAEWVFRHFGEWIRHFHFVPAYRTHDKLPDMGGDKATVIRLIGGADFFVDDDRKNLEAAIDAVPFPILIPQPWNRCSGDMASALAAITVKF